MLKKSEIDLLISSTESCYAKLLASVVEACKETERRLGEGVVRNVYGREEKQAKTSLARKFMKSPEKIARAMDFLGTGEIFKVSDVIGLTIVVYYADKIPLVASVVEDLLRAKRINILERKERRRNGYYATHIVFVSNHTEHRHCRCEVQIKTMLHDAWAAKTHDLIYKPQGRHDARLDRLMNTFAEALQAIEVQSETLREIIEERWASEREWRRLLRIQLFNKLPGWLAQLDTAEGKALRSGIEVQTASLVGLDDESSLLQDFASQIDDLCKISLRDGFMLEAYLAVVQEGAGARTRAVQRTLEWSQIAEAEYHCKRAKSHDVWSVPLFLYTCGELNLAIESGEKLLHGTQLPELDRQIIAFNLANHLIEDAYFALPRDASLLHQRIQALIASASDIRRVDESSFLDAEGMCDVAFSQDPIVLRAAIDKIHMGNTNVPECDLGIAQAYYELHMRLAWRRLLEIETTQARLPLHTMS